MSRPRVSVIIIFLDEERFLAEAVASVRTQTYDDWELLLVDDGSRDRSAAMAQAFASEDASGRIRCLQHPGGANRGMSASRNLGLAAARGELIAFLDGDDVWVPDKLAEQVAVLDREPDAGLVYGRTLIWHGWRADAGAADFTYPLGVPPGRVHAPPRLFNVMMWNRAQTPTTCNAIVRRAVVERVGGFEETFRGLFEDQVFFAKVLLATPTWVDGRLWAKYRIHARSCSEQVAGSADEIRARLDYLAWVRAYLDGHGGWAPSTRFWMARAVADTRYRLWKLRAGAVLRGSRA